MRGLKIFLLLLAILVVAVGGGALVGLRTGRNKVGHVADVKPDMVSVTNAGTISLFAARVAPGPHVIVFDTGLDPQGHPIDALLAGLGAGRDDVTDLFLTHGHFDHVAGSAILNKARVHLGTADIPLAAGQTPPEALVPRLLGKALDSPPVTVNAPLTGAAAVVVGTPDATGAAKVVKAYPVPGHTPGSFAFLYDGVLFVGDIMILKQGRLETTPWIFDPHPEQNKASIRSLKTQLGEETVDIVCTAHGGCTPKGLGRNLLEDLVSRLAG
jgi:hydroxyacylglutathione hydrolase